MLKIALAILFIAHGLEAIAYSFETEFLAFHLAKRQPVRKQWQWVKPRQAKKLGFLAPFFE